MIVEKVARMMQGEVGKGPRSLAKRVRISATTAVVGKAMMTVWQVGGYDTMWEFEVRGEESDGDRRRWPI